MSDIIPPIKYKHSAKAGRDIPGLCGYYVGEKLKKRPCGKTATHRLMVAHDDPAMQRVAWLCKDHFHLYTHNSKLTPSDHLMIEKGQVCAVWRCKNKAIMWDNFGYAICASCGCN